jgi:putative phosphoesterase
VGGSSDYGSRVLALVIADTHLPRGSRRLSGACVEQLRRAELILHAGDLTSVAFLDELRAFGVPVHAVCGNADEPALRAALPAHTVIEASGATIGMVHDAGPRAGREERLVERFDGCSAIVYGHTHLPQVERVDGVWILNPGSPTERRRAPFRSALLLELVPGAPIRPELVAV